MRRAALRRLARNLSQKKDRELGESAIIQRIIISWKRNGELDGGSTSKERAMCSDASREKRGQGSPLVRDKGPCKTERQGKRSDSGKEGFFEVVQG